MHDSLYIYCILLHILHIAFMAAFHFDLNVFLNKQVLNFES